MVLGQDRGKQGEKPSRFHSVPFPQPEIVLWDAIGPSLEDHMFPQET